MGLSLHRLSTFFCITSTKRLCERSAKLHIYNDGPYYKVEDTFINCNSRERQSILNEIQQELKMINTKILKLQNQVKHPKSHWYCFTDTLTPSQQLALHVKYAATAQGLLGLLTKDNTANRVVL